MVGCKKCKKRIPPLMLDIHKCRCDNFYCRIHLYEHNCSFDYNEHYRKQLIEKLPKLVNSQIATL